MRPGRTYNFVLVAYDLFGNPRAHHQVVTATLGAADTGLEPGAGPDLGCGCATSSQGHVLSNLSLVTLIALTRRRRR